MSVLTRGFVTKEAPLNLIEVLVVKVLEEPLVAENGTKGLADPVDLPSGALEWKQD